MKLGLRRSHVGVNHPSALVHTREMVFTTVDGESPCAKFRKRIGGHECTCSSLIMRKRGAQRVCSSRDTREDLGNR